MRRGEGSKRSQGPSRRKSVRRDVLLECSARSELWEGELCLRIADLSEGGLWVETFRPLEVGQELIVAFTPPLADPSQRVWVSTEVVRAGIMRRAGSSPPKRGLGLAIRYCSAEHRRLLAASLRRVPPRLPTPLLAGPSHARGASEIPSARKLTSARNSR